MGRSWGLAPCREVVAPSPSQPLVPLSAGARASPACVGVSSPCSRPAKPWVVSWQ